MLCYSVVCNVRLDDGGVIVLFLFVVGKCLFIEVFGLGDF